LAVTSTDGGVLIRARGRTRAANTKSVLAQAGGAELGVRTIGVGPASRIEAPNVTASKNEEADGDQQKRVK